MRIDYRIPLALLVFCGFAMIVWGLRDQSDDALGGILLAIAFFIYHGVKQMEGENLEK